MVAETVQGRVDSDGRLLLLNLHGFTDCRVDVTIQVHRDTRSQKANAYLWGVVYAIAAEDTGHSPEDLHDAMCERFLPNERKRVEFFNRLTGESLAVDTEARRTSKLSGAPFYDFVENVRQFLREFLHIETPDPDPAYWRHRKQAA